jgi:outer membrane protein TolC
MPIPDDLLKTNPSGVTADQVGARAAATSYSAKAAEESLRGAAARVDAAWVAFLPRLTGTARYTRLSDFTPPAFAAGPPGTPPLTIPLVLNNWLLQANVTVPISDYFLRIDQNYTAAIHSQDAVRFDAVSARAKASSDGKIAYYTWMRARGAVIVAVQALNDQKTHLRDARNLLTAGKASPADVLRAETAVASAELALERAKNLADLTEKQVRVAMHVGDDARLAPAESLDTPVNPMVGNPKQFTQEALTSRYEIKSIDANAVAAKRQVDVTRAGNYPQVSAFADGIYANPNARRFPQSDEWFPTWDVGAQLVWSPNDVVSTRSLVGDAESRVKNLEAQRMVIRDGIEIEVLQAWQGVKEADFSIETSKREIASATEAYRVARELFLNGMGTSTTLTDAETELTRARLDALNAIVDARVARVRLDHALGRDTRPFAAPQ